MPSRICPLKLDGLFYETAAGRIVLPVIPFTRAPDGLGQQAETKMPDGRVVTISVKPEGNDFSIHLAAAPDGDIVKWGLAVAAALVLNLAVDGLGQSRDHGAPAPAPAAVSPEWQALCHELDLPETLCRRLRQMPAAPAAPTDGWLERRQLEHELDLAG